MTEGLDADQVTVHQTSCVLEGAPDEVDAGSIIALKVKVSCSSACDLRGKTTRLITQDAAVKGIESELTDFDGAVSETDEFVVKAPAKPGEYTWTSLFPAQEKEGVLHEESSAPFAFRVKAHTTSVTVWDLPSPIVLGTKFKLKVGVKCSSQCKLTDTQIEVYDHESNKVATGTLRDVPWPDTAGLYWAELELEAPGTEAYHRWTAKLPTTDLKAPHEEGSCNFSFTTSRPPEHVVTVEVIDKRRKGPLEKALVTLIPRDSLYAPYRKRTDDRGLAGLYVPSGGYQLCVDKPDYEPSETSLEVAEDSRLTVEMIYSPADPAADRRR